MERINFNSSRLTEFLDNLNPNNSGIFFSLIIHLTILLFALGIPNIFEPKNIYVPNIVPIEILSICPRAIELLTNTAWSVSLGTMSAMKQPCPLRKRRSSRRPW